MPNGPIGAPIAQAPRTPKGPSAERVSAAIGRRAGIRRAQLARKSAVQQARATGGDVRAARQAGRAGVREARAVPGAHLGNVSLHQLRAMRGRMG